MRSPLILAVLAGIAIAVPAVLIAATGDVARVTLSSTGVQALDEASAAAVSPDGRYVLFTSRAAFTPVSTGRYLSLYMRDLTTGAVTLISCNAAGVPASDDVNADPLGAPYAVSLDGRYVVFSSSARNLAPVDTNGTVRDVFRKDTVTGRVTVVSVDSDGKQLTAGVTGQPDISADGNRIVFTSGTDPLVAADTNGVADIYLFDARARTVRLVSRTASGVQSPTATGRPTISADGRAVAFEGGPGASPLDVADADLLPDIYLSRPDSGSMNLVSVAAPGGTDGASSLPDVSGDGGRVAFLSEGALTPGDSNAVPDAYVRDVSARTTVIASGGGGASGRPGISLDGGRVAFTAGVAPLVGPNDGNAVADVYAWSMGTGAFTLASRTPAGTAPALASGGAAIGGPGTPIAFGYDDAGTTPLIAGDTNAVADVFATELPATDTTHPALSANATATGARIVITGRATDSSGIAYVTVDGRPAVLGTDGAFSVTIPLSIGDTSVMVLARDGVGQTTRSSLAVSRSAAARQAAVSAQRPARLTVRLRGRSLWASFRLPVRAAVRVELRTRVNGPLHAPAYRLDASASARTMSPGARALVVRIPARFPRGRHQVRVLVSTAMGLATAATTIIIP